jgi:hypothetical protein
MAKTKSNQKKGFTKVPLGHVTEPDHGVGSGVGMKGFDSFGENGVGDLNVTRPEKPKIPISAGRTRVVTIGGVQRPALGPDETAIGDAIEETEEGKGDMMEKDNKKESNSGVAVEVKPSMNENKKRSNVIRKAGKDMHSGMELLEVEFLLSVVDNSDNGDGHDVIMRKLCFNELVRSSQRHEISSGALKMYAMDVDGLYGKSIQCEAMLELAERG